MNSVPHPSLPLSSPFPAPRLALLAAGLLLGGCPRAPTSVDSARPVALVNDRPILAMDLRRELWRVHGKPQPGDLGRLTLAEALLDQLIDQELLLRAAREAGFSVPEKDVDAAWESARAGYNNRDFHAALYNQLLTPELMRQRLEERLVIERFLRERFKDLPKVGDEAVRKAYESNVARYRAPARVRARQIVATTAEEAELIREKLVRGEDFERLAREHSVGPERERGGDLGFFNRGIMPEVFDDVCFTLKVGETSPVVASQYGHHIFQVTERRPEVVQPLDMVAAELRVALESEQREAAEAKLLEDLRSSARITRDPAALAWAADALSLGGEDGGTE